MIDFGKIFNPNLGQIIGFFLQKEEVNKIRLGIKRDAMGLAMEYAKKVVNRMEVPYHLQVWKYPLKGV